MKKILNAFTKAIGHNEKNDQKKSFQITYKKLNGRTVKRKIDPSSLRNNVVVAYDHKRKAVRSFKLERIQSMQKTAFMQGFYKQASLGEHLTHAAELGGLGILAAPSIKKMVTGKEMSENNKHKTELAGLGVLAAPSAVHVAKSLAGKFSKA